MDDTHFPIGDVLWRYGKIQTKERIWPSGWTREIWGQEEIDGHWLAQDVSIRFDDQGKPIDKRYFIDGKVVRTVLAKAEAKSAN